MIEDKTGMNVDKEAILENKSPRMLKSAWKDGVTVERRPSEDFLGCYLELLFMERFPTHEELKREIPPILFKIKVNNKISYFLYGATKEGNQFVELDASLVEPCALDEEFEKINKIFISGNNNYKELFDYIKEKKLHSPFIFEIAFKLNESGNIDLGAIAAKSIQCYMEIHHPNSGFQFDSDELSKLVICAPEDKDAILSEAIEYAKYMCNCIEMALVGIGTFKVTQGKKESLKQIRDENRRAFMGESLLRDNKIEPFEKYIIIYALLVGNRKEQKVQYELGEKVSLALGCKYIHESIYGIINKIKIDLIALYGDKYLVAMEMVDYVVDQLLVYLDSENKHQSYENLEWLNLLRNLKSKQVEMNSININSNNTDKTLGANTNTNTNTNTDIISNPMLDHKSYADIVLAVIEKYKKNKSGIHSSALSSDDKKRVKICEQLLRMKIEPHEKYAIIHALLINTKIDKEFIAHVSHEMGFQNSVQAVKYFADDASNGLSQLYKEKSEVAIEIYKKILNKILGLIDGLKLSNLGAAKNYMEILKEINSGKYDFNEKKIESKNENIRGRGFSFNSKNS